jgi:hypothetical protein
MIVAINRAEGLALTDADEVVPITNWLDAEGDECERDEAVMALAGQDGIGWFSLVLDHFERGAAN